MSKKVSPTQWTIQGNREVQRELVANEEPLHITVNGESYVTTMRTADGNDVALTRGLLFTEGIIVDIDVSLECTEITDPETNNLARLDVHVDPKYIRIPIAGRRNQISTSSCGICGTRDPADLELYGDPIKVTGTRNVSPHSILAMVESMAESQITFKETGGTHGVGAFKLDGTPLVVREDIGRHNAVDKVLGYLLENKCIQDADVMTVSGRISYEIVSKVYRAQIPILVAVSAPSSMAVETADAFGITLIGFCREDRLTVYTHPHRVLNNKEQG